MTKSLQIGHERLTTRSYVFIAVRLALVMGAALLAGSAAGAQARQTAPIPPIVFSSGQLDRDLVVMRENGAHRRVLTRTGRDDSDPSWSPDGLRIAFSFFNGRRERVAVLTLSTGRVQDLGDGFNPDWSPDGRRLVFLDADGFDDLVTMNANGSSRHRLHLTGTGIADDTDPAWSPDGREIAFVGDGLWTVPANDGKPRRIRPEGGPGTATWSRDGRTLAFDCATRSFHVCLVREDGTGLRGLTRKGRHPNWSPQGDLIATTRQDVLKPGILVFRPNGKLVRALRNGAASADWSPDGRRLVAERELVGGPRLYATARHEGAWHGSHRAASATPPRPGRQTDARSPSAVMCTGGARSQSLTLRAAKHAPSCAARSTLGAWTSRPGPWTAGACTSPAEATSGGSPAEADDREG